MIKQKSIEETATMMEFEDTVTDLLSSGVSKPELVKVILDIERSIKKRNTSIRLESIRHRTVSELLKEKEK